MTRPRFDLMPERDVEREDRQLVATSDEPWLSVANIAGTALAGRLTEITYSLSFWDEPSRPVFRFWRSEGHVDRIGAGPIAGRGKWVGRVPLGTQRISVSPTNRPGPFDFVVESVRTRWWASVLADGFRWHPRPARSAVLTRLIGWAPESDVNLAWATGSIPLAGYEKWRGCHERLPDLQGLDRPRFDWANAPPIRVIIMDPAIDEAGLRRTMASLQAQVFRNWHALIVGSQEAPQDTRLRTLKRVQAIDEIAADRDGALTGMLTAGDALAPVALAVLAERAHRVPSAAFFYGDELNRGPDGRLRPILKPGWSPRLQAGRPYLGRPVFVRDLRAWARDDRKSFLETGDPPQVLLERIGPRKIHSLRRILADTGKATSAARSRAPVPASGVRASIIIPTRDHPALLRKVVASIRAKSRPGSFRIVVVDNASAEPSTLALLDELRQADDAQVISHSGSFNFSLICNEAAAVGNAEVLVFLNDDMEVRSEGWLDRLVARAMEPDIGAVGARLTYPDGRLQHVGVLVGMGESAGHFGALAAGDDPGWVGRNTVLHEVSAVTGACLAVARDKFDAVGGFDAAHLPIELSDIDLCLKLNAQGWQTVVDPDVHLIHEESASRGGATLRRLSVHGDERAVFVERWRSVLRDDPFFHPGLSLYRWQAALG